ncbi:DUF2795 domain-containing protein [Pseudonocardia sp. KRD291]|uniref:DUF2795 domain-containing protein n=1 Tax=Pseudonocardia sp. KRD291 TaxID=2792007 RepID=UPI001C5C5AE4|nr:DUF2795 domain-containing protein [Pseudonocardia sp. KRD291]
MAAATRAPRRHARRPARPHVRRRVAEAGVGRRPAGYRPSRGFQVTDVQKALAGADYPADGEPLAELARNDGAGNDLVSALRPLREVDGPSGVMSQLQATSAAPSDRAAPRNRAAPGSRARTGPAPYSAGTSSSCSCQRRAASRSSRVSRANQPVRRPVA